MVDFERDYLCGLPPPAPGGARAPRRTSVAHRPARCLRSRRRASPTSSNSPSASILLLRVRVLVGLSYYVYSSVSPSCFWTSLLTPTTARWCHLRYVPGHGGRADGAAVSQRDVSPAPARRTRSRRRSQGCVIQLKRTDRTRTTNNRSQLKPVTPRLSTRPCRAVQAKLAS